MSLCLPRFHRDFQRGSQEPPIAGPLGAIQEHRLDREPVKAVRGPRKEKASWFLPYHQGYLITRPDNGSGVPRSCGLPQGKSAAPRFRGLSGARRAPVSVLCAFGMMLAPFADLASALHLVR